MSLTQHAGRYKSAGTDQEILRQGISDRHLRKERSCGGDRTCAPYCGTRSSLNRLRNWTNWIFLKKQFSSLRPQWTRQHSTPFVMRSRRIKAEFEVGTFEEMAIDFHAKDTICGQVSGRDKKLREFAKNNDVVIFVAGRMSSNGKVLYEIAKSENPKTYFVENESEVDDDWFNGCETVGISGAHQRRNG